MALLGFASLQTTVSAQDARSGVCLGTPSASSLPSNGVIVGLSDLDSDGSFDAVVGHRNTGNVSLFLGNPDGSIPLAPTRQILTGGDSREIAFADIDGDLDQDFVTSDFSLAGQAIVLFNDGAGQFSSPSPYSTGGVTSAAPKFSDLDNDGQLDIVMTNTGSGTLAVLYQLPAGGFAPPALHSVGATPNSVTTVDLDENGWIDIAVGNFGGAGDVSVLLGDALGGLAAESRFAAGLGTFSTDAFDADGDGYIDIVAANRYGASLTLLLGDGSGMLVSGPTITLNGAPMFVVAADIDADLDEDLIVANGSTDTVDFLLYDSPLSFSEAAPVATQPAPRSVALADLDQSGSLDLVAACDSGRSLQTWLSFAVPSVPSSASRYGCGTNPPNSMSVVSGDPAIGQTLTLGLDNPLGTQTVGSLTVLALAATSDPSFPCGTPVPGWGMAGAGDSGELLVSPPAFQFVFGPLWGGAGSPASIPLAVPNDPTLLGMQIYAQGCIVDPTALFGGVLYGLTDAVEITIGS